MYQGEEEVGLLTDLFVSIIECYINEASDEETEESNLLQLIYDYTDEKVQFIWPELLRIIFSYPDFNFPDDEDFLDLTDKLVGVTPQSFSSTFNYEEKTKILLNLINIHDLQGFREYINE